MGQPRPALNRYWKLAGIAALVMMGTFVGTRQGLRALAGVHLREALSAEQQELAMEELDADSRRVDRAVRGRGMEHLWRLSACGTALSSLFWPPAEVGKSHAALGYVTNGIGWLLMLAFLRTVWNAARRREWIWVGALLYCVSLAFLRTPTGRYWSPVAPMLVLGVVQGFGTFRRSADVGRHGRFAVTAAALLLVTSVACNAAILGTNVWVSQSDRFGSICLAGEYAELAGVAQYLHERNVADGEAAISARYFDGRRSRRNTFARRLLHLLTDRTLRLVPDAMGYFDPNELLAQWVEENGVRFYLCRNQYFVPRLWHFRLPWLRPDSGESAESADDSYYVLYEFEGDTFRRVRLTGAGEPRTRIPGL
jgi:hypothetical protein